MSGAVAMLAVGVVYLLGVYNVAIWMLHKNAEFLAKQVPEIEQLESELESLIGLCGEDDND